MTPELRFNENGDSQEIEVKDENGRKMWVAVRRVQRATDFRRNTRKPAAPVVLPSPAHVYFLVDADTGSALSTAVPFEAVLLLIAARKADREPAGRDAPLTAETVTDADRRTNFGAY